jgi:Pectate lyase superfamily protein/Chaperone of endosialidase
MTVNISLFAGAGSQFFDNNGIPLAGGKIQSYSAGTTTPAATYTSSSGLIAHSNPIILDSAGRVPSEIWLTTGSTYKFVLSDSSNVVIGTYDNIPGANDYTTILAMIADVYADFASTSNNDKGDALVGFKQSNSSGFLTNATARTVNDKLQEWVSVLDFGADPTGTNDSTTAIQNAINASSYVLIPFGVYRCDNIITIQSTYSSQKHVLMQSAQLIRKSANSSATGAVVQLLGSYGSFDGGGGFITTQNNSPGGVVVLGHSDNTTSNYTAVHWSFKNVTIEAKVFGSAPTIYQSIGVYIPSSQPFIGSGSANYFGNVENVNVQNASIAFWLTDLVNGCTFVNCTVNGFWYAAFTLQGAYGNTFYGGFLEYCYQNSKVAIQLLTKLYPSAPYASTLQSQWNNFFGSTMELYATSMIGVQIDSGCQGNFVQFNWNTVGTAISDSDGFNTILESRVNQFTKVASNTITGVGQSAQEIGILPTDAAYAAGYGVYVNSLGSFYPNTDNAVNLGTASKRWKEIFAANATINTSDARLKEQDRSLSDAERAVALKVKGLIKAFKFKDAVQAKGNNARIHFGVYAQQIVEAFASEGLDASAYGMLCFDEWESKEAVLDQDGNIIKPAQKAGEVYGIRYEELLAFVISAI